MAWCRRIRSRKIQNWAEEVDRETPPGRIRVMTWPEISALVTAADALDLHQVGDAVILAIDLVWSQIDILNLTWDQIAAQNGRLIVHGARQKTGRVGGTPLLQLGARRLAAIKARQAQMAAQPLKVIHLPRARQHASRAPDADSHYFRDLFEKVRALAAKGHAGHPPCPTVATLTFADTRDTGWTLTKRAGLSDDETISRSRQSRATVKALGDRAYGEVGLEIAGPGADRLDLYVEAQLKLLKVNL